MSDQNENRSTSLESLASSTPELKDLDSDKEAVNKTSGQKVWEYYDPFEENNPIQRWFEKKDVVKPRKPRPQTLLRIGQDARAVCGQISQKLSDANSKAKGSRMFQKRRKRSDKFSIEAYGTQSPEYDLDFDEVSQTGGYVDPKDYAPENLYGDYPIDDEYDSEGYEEEEDSQTLSSYSSYNIKSPPHMRLSPREREIQNQYKNLAMDASQMRGKGAKIFARRQQRMERFTLSNEGRQDIPPMQQQAQYQPSFNEADNFSCQQNNNYTHFHSSTLPRRQPSAYNHPNAFGRSRSASRNSNFQRTNHLPDYNHVQYDYETSAPNFPPTQPLDGYYTDVEDDRRGRKAFQPVLRNAGGGYYTDYEDEIPVRNKIYAQPKSTNYYSDCEGGRPTNYNMKRVPIKQPPTQSWQEEKLEEGDEEQEYYTEPLVDPLSIPSAPFYSYQTPAYPVALPAPSTLPLTAETRQGRPRTSIHRVQPPVRKTSFDRDFENIASRYSMNGQVHKTNHMSEPPQNKPEESSIRPMSNFRRVAFKPTKKNSSTETKKGPVAYPFKIGSKPAPVPVVTTKYFKPAPINVDSKPSSKPTRNKFANVQTKKTSYVPSKPPVSYNNTVPNSVNKQQINDKIATNDVIKDTTYQIPIPANEEHGTDEHNNPCTQNKNVQKENKDLTEEQTEEKEIVQNCASPILIANETALVEANMLEEKSDGNQPQIKPVKFEYKLRVKNGDINKDNQKDTIEIKKFVPPSEIDDDTVAANASGAKVGACMKLLDPNKMFSMKKKTVPTDTPTLDAIKESERPLSRNALGYARSPSPALRYDPNKQMNTQTYPKPTRRSQSASRVPAPPRIPFGGMANSTTAGAKPQPLGSLAEAMRGKGAKIFQRQQERMHKYTMESNGEQNDNVVNGSRRPVVALPPQSKEALKGPGEETRKGMNNVLGQFLSSSSPGNVKPPSKTKKRGRDPQHYLQYLNYRPPSDADFIETPDNTDQSSDVSSVTSSVTNASSLSSYSSNTKQESELVQENFVNKSFIQTPPKVAPKPKVLGPVTVSQCRPVCVSPTPGIIKFEPAHLSPVEDTTIVLKADTHKSQEKNTQEKDCKISIPDFSKPKTNEANASVVVSINGNDQSHHINHKKPFHFQSFKISPKNSSLNGHVLNSVKPKPPSFQNPLDPSYAVRPPPPTYDQVTADNQIQPLQENGNMNDQDVVPTKQSGKQTLNIKLSTPKFKFKPMQAKKNSWSPGV